MSFDNVGRMTLAPGGAVRWGVLRNGGDDFGAQYVGAHLESPGELIFSDQSKFRRDDGKFEYHFTVRNADPSRGVTFHMQGGGFT